MSCIIQPGGIGFDPASPGPIGGTTPASVTATTARFGGLADANPQLKKGNDYELELRTGMDSGPANFRCNAIAASDASLSTGILFTDLGNIPTGNPASAGRMWCDPAADYAMKISQG